MRIPPTKNSLFAACLIPWTLGCSEDGSEESERGASPGNTQMDPEDQGIDDIVTAGPGDDEDDPLAAPTSDGGAVDLTAEEISAIEGAACTGWSAEGEGLPSVLQLVIDASSSMNDPAPGTTLTKWEATRDALDAAIAELPATVALGVLYYPNKVVMESNQPQDVLACINGDALIPIEPLGGPGSPHRTAVEQSLADAELNQWTPTHDAYAYALENGLLPYQGPNRFMLLITDGAPTVARGCVQQQNSPDEQAIVSEIAAANTENGVRTFLIGSPGSEGERAWLSQAATEGGTAADDCELAGPDFCHLDMTEEPDFSAALAAGLSNVVGQIIDSCTFAVPSPPDGQTIDPDLTNVIITWEDGASTLFLPDTQGDCTEGWQFNADGNVALCSASCDRVKADPKATLQLHFGCGSDVIPVR